MIIRDANVFPYMDCSRASLLPETKGSLFGIVAEDGFTCLVTIGFDELHVTVRVRPCAPFGNPMPAAMRAAQRARDDSAWEPLRVDVNDGEVAYVRKWTHHLPDTAEMDAFLDGAIAFLKEHEREIRELDAA